MKEFKDYFSKQSADYTSYRPVYPLALFEFLASVSAARDLAWDCATGNGQAATILSGYFKKVIATDASEAQIRNAKQATNISYLVCPAEKTPIENSSADLITVAQALHWFDFDAFYSEVRRVSRKDSIIAVWAYGLHSINTKIDKIVNFFYSDVVGEYWPKERRYVEERYETISFPFAEIDHPEFSMELEWNFPGLIGYLGTWSSVQKYKDKNGSDPCEIIKSELASAWGDPSGTRKVGWPLFLKVGKIYD